MKIHPNEPLGGIKIILDSQKKGSCDISATFCAKTSIPPQAYYSESHLDTLGFSLFLALAKRGAADFTYVVIDDVFTSVDEKHLTRICDLLVEESDNFTQIIMTTHIRKMLELYRSSRIPRQTMGVKELSSSWSYESGILLRDSVQQSEELLELLSRSFIDRETVAVKTRRLLESILSDIVINLGAYARMKKYGDYDLGDYLCGLRSLANDGLRVKRTQITGSVLHEENPKDKYDLKAKAKEFNENKSIVNKIIHASEVGSSFTDDEVRQFAHEALGLDEYFKCDDPKCHTLIGSRKAFNSCKCGKWKLEILH
jgi:hypothetical protein